MGRPTLKVFTEVGLSGEEVAFWGFAHTDIYQCCPVDTLHQCFNGISLHLIEALQLCIEDTCRSRKDVVFAKIRDRLSSYKSLYHGERIPMDSLWAEKTCAEVSVQGSGGSKFRIQWQTFNFLELQERRAIMQFLPFALHHLDGLPCGLPAFFMGMLSKGSDVNDHNTNAPVFSSMISCHLCVGYARYIQIRDMPRHTTGSICLLEELVFR